MVSAMYAEVPSPAASGATWARNPVITPSRSSRSTRAYALVREMWIRSARVRIDVPAVADQLVEDPPVDLVQWLGPIVPFRASGSLASAVSWLTRILSHRQSSRVLSSILSQSSTARSIGPPHVQEVPP